MGDGVCDEKCNTAGACDFDGGDCDPVGCKSEFLFFVFYFLMCLCLLLYSQKADPNAKPCRRSYIGDGQCDEVILKV